MCSIIVGVVLGLVLCYSLLGIAEGYSAGNTNETLFFAIPILILLALLGLAHYLDNKK